MTDGFGAGNEMTRVINETPQSIVEGGRIHAGAFCSPFVDVNLLDADAYRGVLQRAFWSMRFKEWVGFGVTHPVWYMSLMIQDAKYLGSAVLYLYNRETGAYHECARNRPGRAVKVAANTWHDNCLAEGKGFRIEFVHRLEGGRHEIHVDVAATAKHPAVRADLVLHEDLSQVQPLVVSLPVRETHHAYTHKAPTAVEGTLTVGGGTVVFDPLRDTANLDEHKAMYPYHTRWVWASFTGRSQDGAMLGVNLADHVFNDQQENNENCIWIGDRMVLCGLVHFDFDRTQPRKPWRIRDEAGLVDLTFIPDGGKFERRNLLVAGIDYYQMFGKFNGLLKESAAPDARVIPVVNLYGVAEKMDVRF